MAKLPCVLHRDVTVDRVLEMVENRADSLDDPGVCLCCGEEQRGCEPDAEKYPCQANDCGPYVYGAEEVLLRGWYHEGPDA